MLSSQELVSRKCVRYQEPKNALLGKFKNNLSLVVFFLLGDSLASEAGAYATYEDGTDRVFRNVGI